MTDRRGSYAGRAVGRCGRRLLIDHHRSRLLPSSDFLLPSSEFLLPSSEFLLFFFFSSFLVSCCERRIERKSDSDAMKTEATNRPKGRQTDDDIGTDGQRQKERDRSEWRSIERERANNLRTECFVASELE